MAIDETNRARQKRYRDKNRDKIKERARIWALNNRERLLEIKRKAANKYARQNREHCAAKVKAIRDKHNPATGIRRAARELKRGDITVDEFTKQVRILADRSRRKVERFIISGGWGQGVSGADSNASKHD